MALYRCFALIFFCINFPAASFARDTPLPAAQAFGFKSAFGPEGVTITFDIEKGYHLYLERLKFQPGSDSVVLGTIAIPEGEMEDDPTLGHTRVARGHQEIRIPLASLPKPPEVGTLKVSYQGCQDAGSCYPPQKEILSLENVGVTAPQNATTLSECDASGIPEAADSRSEQCQIVDTLKNESFLSTGISFLGMGILLAFTPCIFPMIPILSGLIAGQGSKIDPRRAFALSLAYVLASALAYTLFGILAGLFGHNLQATLQNPTVIATFSAFFVLLALSMFGAFSLQVPGTLQNHLTALSNRQKQGTLLGSATMGFLSALIVGPCVAAPLAGALIYIGETGDAIFGGFALFCLGIGMGLPLLAIGTSAGTLLPKAGTWMDAIKSLFGFGLLGVALWLLDRILPSDLMLFLWGALLILAAMGLGALEALPHPSGLLPRFAKGAGVILLAYGVLLLIGAASEGNDPLHPLENLSLGHAESRAHSSSRLAFMPVSSVAELDEHIQNAERTNKPVMLDFYADWCTACQEMESETFSNPQVQNTLKQVILLKADVTDQTEANLALLRRFNLVGPPATLFFKPGSQEVRHRRVVGYMEAAPFNRHVMAALGMTAESPAPKAINR
jgi:thioredoxin:protein disulfide reductase